MNIVSTIKFSYHLFVFLFLLYLAFFFHLPTYIRNILFIIAFIHLYDCWWFYNYTGNAPI